MTNEQHLITPPPELVEQWYVTADNASEDVIVGVANRAAQWGLDQRGAAPEAELQKAADQELEACCEWLDIPNNRSDRGDGWLMPVRLRAARRPKPPSLKEQALNTLDEMSNCIGAGFIPKRSDLNTIRRALEQLND